eukprot:1582613-Prymnesium_polylepis.1
MLCGNQLYWLLLLVPLALAADQLDLPTGLTFGLTLVALLPLAVRRPVPCAPCAHAARAS